MRGLAWTAIIAAFNIAFGLLLSGFGAAQQDWFMLAYGGVQVLAGVGFAMLALRE